MRLLLFSVFTGHVVLVSGAEPEREMYNLILKSKNQTGDSAEARRFLAMDRYAHYLKRDSLPVRVGRNLLLSVGTWVWGLQSRWPCRD